MSRFVRQSIQYFVIPVDRQAGALQAIKDLAGHEEASEGIGFDWVDPGFAAARSLDEALRCWRWEPVRNETDAIVGLNFCGHRLGHERILFEALAPFTECGSFIELEGKKGLSWRWYFENGTCGERVLDNSEPEITAKQALEMCVAKIENLTREAESVTVHELSEPLRIMRQALKRKVA